MIIKERAAKANDFISRSKVSQFSFAFIFSLRSSYFCSCVHRIPKVFKHVCHRASGVDSFIHLNFFSVFFYRCSKLFFSEITDALLINRFDSNSRKVYGMTKSNIFSTLATEYPKVISAFRFWFLINMIHEVWSHTKRHEIQLFLEFGSDDQMPNTKYYKLISIIAFYPQIKFYHFFCMLVFSPRQDSICWKVKRRNNRGMRRKITCLLVLEQWYPF